MALEEVSGLADAVLVGRLEQLVRSDRALSAKLLVHLGEVKARGLYLERGFSSMFEYCRSGLGMSEAEAGLRILAAGVGRRFPLVLERLGEGAVSLSTIKLLAPHLTVENHVQLLDRARGMTKRQVELLVADLAPKPDVPARIRKLPEKRTVEESNSTTKAPSSAALVAAEPHTATAMPVAISSAAQSSTFALQSPRARACSAPLGRGRFSLHVTLGHEAHVALEQLVELLRHQNPSGDFTCIVERALCEMLKREMKRRFAQTDAAQPRAKGEAAAQKLEGRAEAAGDVEAKAEAAGDVEAKAEAAGDVEAKAEPEIKAAKREVSSSKSRYIPRAVLREVHARDGGQCTFVSSDGRRCAERGFLELHHHERTFARGGEATAENLRLTCRAHNMFYAERDYGRTFMQGKLRDSKFQARTNLDLVSARISQ